ncbi:MAG: phosphate ABC transporter substrate-binding protein PstS family protein [Candidatus Eisenbacteria bacterium]|nr:phosphate ABC transporter substrate-binding protein PstS family protein [Candidatus Eisenbacteria bacterium]
MRRGRLLGGSLAALILCAFAGLLTPTLAQEAIVIDGSTTVGPIAKAFAEHYMAAHPEINITVSESGSGNGAKSLINGTCHIADMSRFMKDAEFSAAVKKGVLPVAHVVAVDGIAMIVHRSNPVQNLTLEQTRGIYLGQYTDWSQLGGPNQKIVVVSRDTNSGTYETFEQLVMQKQKMAEGVEYLGSNGAVRQKVQSTPTAIGYVGLGFIDRTVKALTVEGIAPGQETVASGRYPIARPLFMFTDGYPRLGTPLHAFITMHLSLRGQEIIEAIGFVPVTSY